MKNLIVAAAVVAFAFSAFAEGGEPTEETAQAGAEGTN